MFSGRVRNVSPSDPYWANVVCLMHMNGANNAQTFTDKKGHTVTNHGSAIVTSTSQSKFIGSAGYNPATTANNGLEVTLGATDGNLSGDLTIEFFARHDDLNSGSYHVMLGPWAGVPAKFLLRIDNGANLQLYAAGSSRFSISVASAGINSATWQFYQLVRSGSSWALNIDGSQKTTWTDSSAIDLSTLVVFAETYNSSTAADQMRGHMAELRITKGVARPNVVPTSPFPG